MPISIFSAKTKFVELRAFASKPLGRYAAGIKRGTNIRVELSKEED
jgi:hypothetical protein